MDIEDLIKLKVKKIIRLLVAGEYRRLEEMNKIGKLSSDELEEAILQYGERLSFPPEEWIYLNQIIHKIVMKSTS